LGIRLLGEVEEKVEDHKFVHSTGDLTSWQKCISPANRRQIEDQLGLDCWHFTERRLKVEYNLIS